MRASENLYPEMDRVQRMALIIAVAALVPYVLGAFFNRDQFFHSYLLAFIFWVGIAVGCAAVLMLHHLTGGGWGLIIRRSLESGTRTLPLMAVLALPLLLAAPRLYVWADASKASADELLRHKQPYLNVPFFALRTALYFTAWLTLAYFLNKWSREQDERGKLEVGRRLRALSGPGLVVYGLTATLASIDWVMSLDPHWFSTAFGMIFMVGQVLTTLAFAIGVAMMLVGREPLSRVASRSRLVDLGNLMLAFVMLWAYISFSQFLIIWSGNLPEEITWYKTHLKGGWAWIAIFLIVFHFALPFLLLLSRDIKSKARSLQLVAAGIILVRLVDLYWVIKPATGGGLRPHWMDVIAPIAIGGIWVSFFVWQLKGRPLLPVNDPQLRAELRHE